MRRHQRKVMRYGLGSAMVTFLGGLAVTALLLPETPFNQTPRWKGVLWMYIGAHFVELSNVHIGGTGLATFQPVEIAEVPTFIYALPPIAASTGAVYTCYQIHSSKIKHNVSNGISAGMAYFLITLLAIFISDARPTISAIIGIALFVGGGIWIGSLFVGKLSGGLPFIGIASLGLVASIGIVLLLGSLAILAALWGVFVISFGSTAAIGLAFGVERNMKRRGSRKGATYPRLKGLRIWLEHNWPEAIAVAVVLIALFIGLTNEQIAINNF